jgi:prepilin-type N-terminal cleavage/methylation domain-containing protein
MKASWQMKLNRNYERGFSLLEVLIVIGVIFILSAITMMKSFGTLDNYHANSAMDAVVSQLRVARQVAISQRRSVVVSFDQSNMKINYQVMAPTTTGTTEQNGSVVTMTLPKGTQFLLESGVPDTPMGFGNSAPIYIGNLSGGPSIMQFNSTGTFTDITGFNTLNGTVFVGVANKPTTARAITVMGSTGRVRQYSYIGGTGTASQVWTQ